VPSFLFMRLFDFFVLSCMTLSEMPMMGMIDPSSIGILTCVKSLATMFESVVLLYPNNSQ
jgi:hypothetical protein